MFYFLRLSCRTQACLARVARHPVARVARWPVTFVAPGRGRRSVARWPVCVCVHGPSVWRGGQLKQECLFKIFYFEVVSFRSGPAQSRRCLATCLKQVNACKSVCGTVAVCLVHWVQRLRHGGRVFGPLGS